MVDTSSITFTGKKWLSASSTPRLPESLYPHAQSEPSFLTTKVESKVVTTCCTGDAAASGFNWSSLWRNAAMSWRYTLTMPRYVPSG